MNYWHETLSGVATWIWWASAAASILAVMVWLVHRGLARVLSARWGYALWYLVFLRLIIPFSPQSELSLFNLGRAPAPPPLLDLERPKLAATDLVSPSTDAALALAIKPGSSFDPIMWGAYLWLAGAGAFLLIVLRQHGQLTRRLSKGSAGDLPLQGRVDGLRRSLGVRSPVMVLTTELITTPAVFGWWRPRLLLPRSRLSEWSEAELDWVLRHELAHVKRHDVLMNWALIAVQILHWFNPVIWWALRRLRAERELICDAAVLKGLAMPDRQAYGSFLIRLMDANALPNQILVPILSHKHHLKRRITMIAESQPPRYAWIVALLACLGLACLTFTRAAEAPPAKAPARDAVAPATAPKATEPKPTESKIVRNAQIETDEAILEELRKELQNLDEKIRKHEAMLDELQANMYGEGNSALESSRLIGTLENQRLEARAEFTRLDILRNQLRQLPSNRLRATAATLLPDPSLQGLLEAEAKAQQQTTQMAATYDKDHPAVKGHKLVLESIQKQIDERLEGLLAGLETQRDMADQRNALLAKELDMARAGQIRASSRQRPYQQLQRSLDNLQEVRDLLHKRILEDEINLKLPPSAKLRASTSDFDQRRRALSDTEPHAPQR